MLINYNIVPLLIINYNIVFIQNRKPSPEGQVDVA